MQAKYLVITVFVCVASSIKTVIAATEGVFFKLIVQVKKKLI